jgi:hypothetical protein
MDERVWFCVGGPLHGKWRPAGLEMHCVEPTTTTAVYASVFGRRTVAIPAAPVVYLATTMQVPGWRIPLPIWAETRIAQGLAAVTFAAVLPGGLHHVPREAWLCCRWCFGPVMPGLETCKSPACRANWASVRALDTMDWRGEA